MKKFLVAFLAVCMSFGLFGCGASVSVSVPSNMNGVNVELNTIESVGTAEELQEKTGIKLVAPEGADFVFYSIIHADNDVTMAEMEYTLDDLDFTARAVKTDMTEMLPYDEDAKAENIIGFDMDRGDILGFDCTWELFSTQIIGNCDAFVMNDDKGTGYAAWLDTEKGVLYNLGLEFDATQENLLNNAIKLNDAVNAQ